MTSGGQALPASGDLIDDLLGLTPESPLHALRRRRPEALRHAEGAFRELLLPDDPGGISRAERALLAMRVAARERDGALAARYRTMVVEAGGDPDAAPVGEGRLPALLRYADKVAAEPESTTRADLDGLAALGLSARDIVAATQLLSFVPYQIRVLAGLRALQQEMPR
jgi:uncharacterized protein YciW